MADSNDLKQRLQEFQNGDLSLDDILADIARLPFETHAIGRIDALRSFRTGIPEVIFADKKPPAAVAQLFQTYIERGEPLFATRCSHDVSEALRTVDGATFFQEANIWATFQPKLERAFEPFLLTVVSAGTLDQPVAEEAAITASLFGLRVERCYDVGVAGLNRLLPQLDALRRADVVVVVAGMDGALPSVLGGLIDSPLIAVPTSVGYGAAFHGLSSLLSMLNACSPGVTVCNIDNGFGAASSALKIIRRLANISSRQR